MSAVISINRQDELNRSNAHRLIKESDDAMKENKKALNSLISLLKDMDRTVHIPAPTKVVDNG